MPPPADNDVQISSVDWVENGTRTGLLLVGRAADGRSASMFFTGCPIYFYVIPHGRPSDKQREAFRAGLDDAIFSRRDALRRRPRAPGRSARASQAEGRRLPRHPRDGGDAHAR